MSARVDQELSCQVCGDAFVFSKGEQSYFRDKGLSRPRRCPKCRDARRPPLEPEPARSGHEAVCSACGALTRLPFEPMASRPVYCPDCFRNR